MTKLGSGTRRVILLESDSRRSSELRSALSTFADTITCSAEQLAAVLSEKECVSVLIGSLPDGSVSPLQLAETVRKLQPNAHVVLLAPEDEGCPYLPAPSAGLTKAIAERSPPEGSEWHCSELIGTSFQMEELRRTLGRIAASDGTVLLTGETGTGKELAARAIHRMSRRRAAPLVAVNCAAIPETLLESELFGFERGAFTGAVAKQEGKLKAADRGMLFLDEIGDMTACAQAKVLRVLETKELQPLGAKAVMRVDVRFLAATHRNLEHMIAERRLRDDLFFRLNVMPVHLTPLRERREDIPVLVQHFVGELNDRYQKQVEGLSAPALDRLLDCDWPGNVRQLRNVIEAGFLMCTSHRISDADLTVFHWSKSEKLNTETVNVSPVLPFLAAKPEPERLIGALDATRWNVSKTASLLNWSRMTVYRKTARYGLSRPKA